MLVAQTLNKLIILLMLVVLNSSYGSYDDESRISSEQNTATLCEEMLKISDKFILLKQGEAQRQLLQVQAKDPLTQFHLNNYRFVEMHSEHSGYIEQVLDQLFANPKLKYFFSRILIQNHIYIAQAEALLDLITEPSTGCRYTIATGGYGQFIPLMDAIIFHDLLFSVGSRVFNQTMDIRPNIILHELAHAFDGDNFQFSLNRDFLRLSGWLRVQTPHGAPTKYRHPGLEASDYLEITNQVRAAISVKNHQLGYNISRNWARKHKVPTRVALADPHETFAEVLSYLILDPQASEYLSPELINWFEVNVFKSKRASYEPF